MPDFILTPAERDDLVAYILGLRLTPHAAVAVARRATPPAELVRPGARSLMSRANW